MSLHDLMHVYSLALIFLPKRLLGAGERGAGNGDQGIGQHHPPLRLLRRRVGFGVRSLPTLRQSVTAWVLM